MTDSIVMMVMMSATSDLSAFAVSHA